jgi:hypothetical protein
MFRTSNSTSTLSGYFLVSAVNQSSMKLLPSTRCKLQILHRSSQGASDHCLMHRISRGSLHECRSDLVAAHIHFVYELPGTIIQLDQSWTIFQYDVHHHYDRIFTTVSNGAARYTTAYHANHSHTSCNIQSSTHFLVSSLTNCDCARQSITHLGAPYTPPACSGYTRLLYHIGCHGLHPIHDRFQRSCRALPALYVLRSCLHLWGGSWLSWEVFGHTFEQHHCSRIAENRVTAYWGVNANEEEKETELFYGRFLVSLLLLRCSAD